MSEHVLPVRTYLLVFVALTVMTVVTWWVAFIDFGALNDVIALGIACFKAVLVILWFMHVKFSTRLTWAFVAAGFFWLAILLALTAGDYASRDWEYNPQSWEAQPAVSSSPGHDERPH